MVLTAGLALALAGPLWAQTGNAAELYQQAFKAMGCAPYGTEEGALITTEERNFLAELGPVLSPEQAARVEFILTKGQPAVDAISAAALARKCDWDLDYTKGFELPLPHLSALRNAARLMRAKTLLNVANGDEGGTADTLAALGNMSVHSGQDQVLISSLVGSAVTSLMTDLADTAIESGAVDAKSAEKMLEAMGALKGNDPFQYGAAMKGEYTMLKEQLAKPDAGRMLQEMLGDSPDSKAAAAMSPDEMRQEVRQMKGLYDRAAAAFGNPDPEAGRAEIRAVQQEVESGKAGKLAKLVMPSLERCYEAKLRSAQSLALLFARLQAIADGKLEKQEYLNAAIPLARASQAAGALDATMQEALELLRVAPSAMDDDARQRVDQLMERLKPQVMGNLARAAGLKKARFAVLGLANPSLNVRFLGGLRGATRVALAHGLQQARAAKDGSLAVPGVILAVRAAALLSTDPTLARAHVAQSIWAEAASALKEAQAISPISQDARDNLDLALATMGASDPFGWRKGLELDVVAMVADMRQRQPGAATQEAVEMRQQVLKQRGANSCFARVAFMTSLRGEDDRFPLDGDAVLVRLTDLWPEKAAAAVHQAAQDFAQANRDAPEGVYTPGAGTVRFDLPLEEQRALFRKQDPVRGLTYVDVQTAQGNSGAVYTSVFDALATPR